MSINSDKDIIKDRLPEYLKQKGIDVKHNFRCLNPAHEDKHPSMGYHEESKKVICFSCNASYDIFDLIGIDYGIPDFSEQLKKARKMFINPGFNDVSTGKNPENSPKLHKNKAKSSSFAGKKAENDTKNGQFLKACAARNGQTAYYEQRGLSESIIKSYGLGYDPDFITKGHAGNVEHWQAAIIPTGPDTYIARNTDQTADKLDRVRKSSGAASIFNVEALRQEGCFIVEGEFDALSILAAGGHACALGGTKFINKLCGILKGIQEETPISKPLIIYMDNDQEGENAAKQLINQLAALHIPYLTWAHREGIKDANEELLKDRAGFTRRIEDIKEKVATFRDLAADQNLEAAADEKTEYLNNRIDNYISLFVDGIKASANTSYIPTGFKCLDIEFDGGLYEGLYIIGAISSLGKTTLVLQLADNIAAIKQDVIIFSLEQARTELMSKSISRFTLIYSQEQEQKAALAKTARGITTGSRYKNYSNEEIKAINAAIGTYKRNHAANLYIIEGVGDVSSEDIRTTVQKHIQYTGNIPVVVIDYLQLIAPFDPRSTDKQNTDRAVLALKRVARDYKTPIIAVSSFNRQSYNAAVTMEAFKESGAIEYASDVLIGLQLRGVEDKNFNANEAKRKNPREIELVLLKQRNGRVGAKISYQYYPMYNYFVEDTRQSHL